MDLEVAASFILDKEREFEDLYHDIECEIARERSKKAHKRMSKWRAKYEKLKICVLELDSQVKKLEEMNSDEDIRRDSLDRQLWAAKKACG